MIKKFFFTASFFVEIATLAAQPNLLFEALPMGRYAVGFKIITITDKSRVALPEFNYMGEKNNGDRFRKITIHLWYPAIVNAGNRKINYGEYSYNHLLSGTNESLDDALKNSQSTGRRRSVEGWFGKPSDLDWKRLLDYQMWAQADAPAVKAPFPLLIGILRSLSTSLTNEMLASNRYVVAMIKSDGGGTQAENALSSIPDMQFSISYLASEGFIDDKSVGTFGFSGSGFGQVLFSMNDHRLKAVADIESGIYMEGLYQLFSASNYYNPSKLRIPFLHIFSHDLSKQEKYIKDFEVKARFSERYQLLINQPGLHHWDFAIEGYTSCKILNLRGAEHSNIEKSFELANIYLLNFFNAQLKNDPASIAFLKSKPSLAAYNPDLWDIRTLSASKPAPDGDDLENIIRTKGIATAMDIIDSRLKNDSSSNIWQDYVLNRLGQTFLIEKKFKEAIEILKLNTVLHPNEPRCFDSLAEVYEASGDRESMKTVSRKVLDLLKTKSSLTQGEKSLQTTANRRLQ